MSIFNIFLSLIPCVIVECCLCLSASSIYYLNHSSWLFFFFFWLLHFYLLLLLLHIKYTIFKWSNFQFYVISEILFISCVYELVWITIIFSCVFGCIFLIYIVINPGLLFFYTREYFLCVFFGWQLLFSNWFLIVIFTWYFL